MGLVVYILLIAFVSALPALIVAGVLSHTWSQSRMRRAARGFPCQVCGRPLGEAALAEAETALAKNAATAPLKPGFRYRMVRRLWAVCTVCGAGHDYDGDARAFFLIEPNAPIPQPASPSTPP